MQVKLYGGPEHGQMVSTEGVVVQVPIYDSSKMFELADKIEDKPPYRIAHYNVSKFGESAITKTGKHVVRYIHVAVFEGGINYASEVAMRCELDEAKWEWPETPSFLHDFASWWEMKLYQIAGVNPLRRP